MNVFVNEPLLDWEKYARRLAREQSSAESLAATFPKKKIDIARRKLEGENPAHITLAELTESTIQQRVRCPAVVRVGGSDALAGRRVQRDQGDRGRRQGAQRARQSRTQVLVREGAGYVHRAPLAGRRLLTPCAVECLVDQATDPNILGRTWAGWAAWI